MLLFSRVRLWLSSRSGRRLRQNRMVSWSSIDVKVKFLSIYGCKRVLTLISKFMANFWDNFTGKLIQWKNSGMSYRPFYWKTHSDQMSHSIHVYGLSKKMNGWFLMDEFPRKTTCMTPQNFLIKDWISFPVKRPVWRPRILLLTIRWVFRSNGPRNLPIRVSEKFQRNF